MKHSLQSVLLIAMVLASSLPSCAQEGVYQSFKADVPFKFRIGSRNFAPGQYQFIVVGPGLLALTNSKDRVVARLLTRSIRKTGIQSASHLVFHKTGKHLQLGEIWAEGKDLGLQVLGEEAAVRQMPSQPASPSLDLLMFQQRSPRGPHLKQ